jgi:hypothetical protein
MRFIYETEFSSLAILRLHFATRFCDRIYLIKRRLLRIVGMAAKKRTVSAATVPRPSTRSLAGVKAAKSIRTTEAVVKVRSKAKTTDGINTDPAVGKRSRKATGKSTSAAESPAVTASTGNMAVKGSTAVRPERQGLPELEVDDSRLRKRSRC